MLTKDTICFYSIRETCISFVFILTHCLHTGVYIESLHEFGDLNRYVFISAISCVRTAWSHSKKFAFSLLRQLENLLTMLHWYERVLITVDNQQWTSNLLNSSIGLEPSFEHTQKTG